LLTTNSLRSRWCHCLVAFCSACTVSTAPEMPRSVLPRECAAVHRPKHGASAGACEWLKRCSLQLASLPHLRRRQSTASCLRDGSPTS
jgi:hypothetical protein